MKLENFLAQYLYDSKSLTLQGIGKFELAPDFIAPQEGDKDFVMPENAIVFNYDGRATEDDALVNYIVKQTKKIKPLASADLDSYLTLGKQFLNIGKPFNIEGIGALEKNQKGEYFFTQGQYINQKIENTLSTSTAKENIANEISFASKPKGKKSNKKTFAITGLVLLLGLLVGGVWYFIKNQQTVTTTSVPETTNVVKTETTIDSNSITKDSISKAPTTATATNANGFEVIIKEYATLTKANDRLDDLKKAGHNVSIFTSDSIKYKIALQVSKPLADSVYVLDSLRRFFGGKPVIKN
ncbi:MAG: hypothetical protein KA319_12130 [Ferruginibacter sp.]|nr:hypothetical protein [Ferruginibacter sp.]